MIENVEEVFNFEVAIENLDLSWKMPLEGKVSNTTAATVTGSNGEEAIVTKEMNVMRTKRRQRPLCLERTKERQLQVSGTEDACLFDMKFKEEPGES